LDTYAIYHACPNRMLASFEKLNRDLVSFRDGHTCQIKRIGIVHIKLFDGMVRKLKDVRYIGQLNKKLISVGGLEAQSLKKTLEEGVLKMFSGSLVVLKDIECNKLYYLKGITVTENLTKSEYLEGDSTRLWQMSSDMLVSILCKHWLSKGY